MTSHHLTLAFNDFQADLVFTGDWSLYHLAESLIEALGFDFDHAFEFCDNWKRPYSSKERYSVFADAGMGNENDVDSNERGVKATSIGEVFTKKRKMGFHFDFGDDWVFLVTCTDVQESSAKRKSRKITARRGQPPVQYEKEEE